MDGQRFDALVRSLAARHTRRGVLKTVVATAVGGLVSSLGSSARPVSAAHHVRSKCRPDPAVFGDPPPLVAPFRAVMEGESAPNGLKLGVIPGLLPFQTCAGDLHGCSDRHTDDYYNSYFGVDFGTGEGSTFPVRAAAGGTLVRSLSDEGGGAALYIKHDGSPGWQTKYLHLSEQGLIEGANGPIKRGETRKEHVKAGDILGWADNHGGVHLHFELRGGNTKSNSSCPSELNNAVCADNENCCDSCCKRGNCNWSYSLDGKLPGVSYPPATVRDCPTGFTEHGQCSGKQGVQAATACCAPGGSRGCADDEVRCEKQCCGAPPNAEADCNDDGTCGLYCKAGFADCDGDPVNGCECASGWCLAAACCPEGTDAICAEVGGSVCANTKRHARHCGGCGIDCNGTSCNDGECCPINAPFVCDGQCVDTLTDPRHCGFCGNLCQAGTYCTNGACCPGAPGYAVCDGVCTQLGTDANCSGCSDACGGGETCQDGQCLQINPGLCDGDPYFCPQPATPCNGPSAGPYGCFCLQTPGGGQFCADDFICALLPTCAEGCPDGWSCTVSTCCDLRDGVSRCLPPCGTAAGVATADAAADATGPTAASQ